MGSLNFQKDILRINSSGRFSWEDRQGFKYVPKRRPCIGSGILTGGSLGPYRCSRGDLLERGNLPIIGGLVTRTESFRIRIPRRGA